MPKNLVRSALTFLVFQLTVAHGQPQLATCMKDLVAHLDQTTTVGGQYVPFLLRDVPHATMVARVMLRGKPVPDVGQFDLVERRGNDLIVSYSGARERLLQKTADVLATYGKQAEFQILHGARTGEVFTLARPRHMQLLGAAYPDLERTLEAKNFEGINIYDDRGRAEANALPAKALKDVDHDALESLGIAIVDGGVKAWTKHRQLKDASRAPVLFRGPGYVITTVEAFRILSKVAGLDAEARALTLPIPIERALNTCADQACEIVEDVPMHLTDPMDMFAYLVGRSGPDADPTEAGFLEKALRSVWSLHLPNVPADVGNVKLMDGRQIFFDHNYPATNAKARLVGAWSVLVARLNARPVIKRPTPPPAPTEIKGAGAPSGNTRAKSPTRRKPTPKPAPAPAPEPAPVPEPAEPKKPTRAVAPARRTRPLPSIARAGQPPEVITPAVAAKVFSILLKHKTLVGPAASGGVTRGFLDTMFKFQRQVDKTDYESAKTELKNLNIPGNAYDQARNGKPKALAGIAGGVRILQWLSDDPGQDQPLSEAAIDCLDEHLNEAIYGGGIKVTRVVSQRTIELPGQRLPLTLEPTVHRALQSFGMDDDAIRQMIVNWHGVRESNFLNKAGQDWTVMIPPISAARARLGGAVIAELNGTVITGVRQDVTLELEFYGRMANRQDLMPAVIKVKMASEHALRHIHVPPRVQAELRLKNFDLDTVEDILAKTPRRQVGDGPGTCFELRRKDDEQAYVACFDNFGSPVNTTLLEFSLRAGQGPH